MAEALGLGDRREIAAAMVREYLAAYEATRPAREAEEAETRRRIEERQRREREEARRRNEAERRRDERRRAERAAVRAAEPPRESDQAAMERLIRAGDRRAVSVRMNLPRQVRGVSDWGALATLAEESGLPGYLVDQLRARSR